MRIPFGLASLSLLLLASTPALAYKPVFPKNPYFFFSHNQKFLIEVTPQVVQATDSVNSYVLVKKSQRLTLYRESSQTPKTWDEQSSFSVQGLKLINEVLITNDGKRLVVRTDENPMTEQTNREDALFVYSEQGRKLQSFSHAGVFKKPGNFRSLRLKLEGSELLISFAEGEAPAKRLRLP